MKIKPKKVLTLAAFGVLSLFLAPQASAASHDTCTRYADKAAGQQRQNNRRNCGFQGPRWHAQKSLHYGWCLVAPRAERIAGTRYRRNKLNQCRGGGNQGGWAGPLPVPPIPNIAKRARCNTYANTALRQYRRAQDNRCGLNGGLWHNNRNSHFNWCMGVTNAQRNARTASRRNRLNICLRGNARPPAREPRPTVARCNRNADVTMTRVRRYLNNRCGNAGGIWHTHRPTHFNWCMQSTRQQRNARAVHMRDRLNRCPGAGANPPPPPQPRFPVLRGLSQSCERYANDAVYNSVLNVSMLGGNQRCAPRSPLWSTSFRYHYNACLPSSQAQRNQNARIRANDIARCRARR